MHVLYRQEARERVNKMTSAVGHFPRCPPESPEKIAGRSAGVCRESRTQNITADQRAQESPQSCYSVKKPLFTSQAILLDINKFCSVLLILICLIPPRSKLTPCKLLQQSRSHSFATAPPQFVLSFLQGFNTHLTQSHMCCSTAGNPTSTEL